MDFSYARRRMFNFSELIGQRQRNNTETETRASDSETLGNIEVA